MDNKKNSENSSVDPVSIRDVLFILKQNIVLMLVVIVTTIAIGVAYAFMEKPEYRAREQVVYTAQNTIDPTTTNNINAMRAYIDTVMDFCDEGVVLDRANYYYADYKNNKASYKDVEEYLSVVSKNDTYEGQQVQDKSFLVDNLKVITSGEEEAGFVFYIEYVDTIRQDAEDKVKVLVFAFNKEVKSILPQEDGSEIKYFDGISINIKDLGLVGVYSTVSKTKTILTFSLIGVIVAILAVYLRNLFDKTIKDRGELEKITGTQVISCIEKNGGDD